MGISLRQKIKQLPLEQQQEIEERSKQLIAEEIKRQQRTAITENYSRAKRTIFTNRAK